MKLARCEPACLGPMNCKSTHTIILFAVFSAVLLLLSSSVLYAQEPAARTSLEYGIEHGNNAEYPEAIDAFKYAIQYKPDYAEAYYNLGHVYYHLHRYSEAADAYKEAVRISPGYEDAYITLGVVSCWLNRHDEAIAAFRKTIRINPKNAGAYYNLGKVYIETQRLKDAIKAFRQAVEIKPTFAEARYNLGLAYLDFASPASREEMLQSAKKQHNSLKRLNKNLAESLGKLIKENRVKQLAWKQK